MLSSISFATTPNLSPAAFKTAEDMVDQTLSKVELIKDDNATGPQVDAIHALLNANIEELRKTGNADDAAQANKLASLIPANVAKYGDLKPAVREFQSMAGLSSSDAQTGRETWAALLGVQDPSRFAYGTAGLAAAGKGTATKDGLLQTFGAVNAAVAPAAATPPPPAASTLNPTGFTPPPPPAPVKTSFTPATAQAAGPNVTLKMGDFAAVARGPNKEAAQGYIDAAMTYGQEHAITPAAADELAKKPVNDLTLAEFGQISVAKPELGAAIQIAIMTGKKTLDTEALEIGKQYAAKHGVTSTPAGGSPVAGGARGVPATTGPGGKKNTDLERLNSMVTNSLGGSSGELTFGAPGTKGQISPTRPAATDLSGSQVGADGRLAVWAYVKHRGDGSRNNPTVDAWVNVGSYTLADLKDMTTDEGGDARVNMTLFAKQKTGIPTGVDKPATGGR